ncbi:efflux RND transporter periplasmic adaptor subunit [Shewanella loihica]|uniref:Efflux transporter, RND family, MFP subunit n=1 Tax=Shewanella loihica (strain ATCC BAA-1088 / PV-4) TaxID=323850 RepID=A3QFQ7_SHELP|nr:efflux RND transporter periplasmic adaptor subunit [Shewanella loihica]ABO24305.1 efflux transporter, RND family, MFP subunit [Shewanella loihica PV-4]
MQVQHTLSIGILLSLVSLVSGASELPTMTVAKHSQPQWITLDAQLEAVKSATVSAQTSGRIIKINYDVNDIVPQGASLLEITSKAQGAELAAAEADFARAQAQNEEAQKQRKRYEQLFPQGAISQGDMDQAIANARASAQAVSAARARIIQANESLQYTTVSAPFAGVVTKRHVEVGETVSPGQALLSGFATEHMRAVTHVPLRYIDALRANPKMKLVLTNGKELESDALTIFSFADAKSHSYKTRIDLPPQEPNLMPGMWVKASFNAGDRNTLTIPESAVIYNNELSAVYLMQNNQFMLNQVRLGNKQGDSFEVLSGLSDGDTIAVDAYQVLLKLKQ